MSRQAMHGKSGRTGAVPGRQSQGKADGVTPAGFFSEVKNRHLQSSLGGRSWFLLIISGTS
jgi:hypothetical protein